MWCGERSCEDKIKELTNATARCLPFNQMPFDDVYPVCDKKVLFAKAIKNYRPCKSGLFYIKL